MKVRDKLEDYLKESDENEFLSDYAESNDFTEYDKKNAGYEIAKMMFKDELIDLLKNELYLAVRRNFKENYKNIINDYNLDIKTVDKDAAINTVESIKRFFNYNIEKKNPKWFSALLKEFENYVG